MLSYLKNPTKPVVRESRIFLVVVILLVLVPACRGNGGTSTTADGTGPTNSTSGSQADSECPEVDATLHWIDDGDRAVLDNLTVPEGEVVLLQEDWVAGQRPTYFRIELASGGFIDSVVRSIGMTPSGDAETDTLSVVDTESCRVESDRTWTAATPGPDHQAEYVFLDDFDRESPVIYVTDNGLGIRVEGVQGADVINERGGVPYRLEAVGERLFIEFSVTSDMDRDLSVELLLPWEENPEQNLRFFTIDYLNYVADLSEEPFEPDQSLFDEFSGEFFPEMAPNGWEAFTNTEELTISSEDTSKVTVVFSTPIDGRGAFAVRLVDTSDPSAFVTSNIIEIQQQDI